MKEAITHLYNSLRRIETQSSQFPRVGLEHGSSDQNRSMLIESIFEQATGHIEMAIKQLEILERQLYS